MDRLSTKLSAKMQEPKGTVLRSLTNKRLQNGPLVRAEKKNLRQRVWSPGSASPYSAGPHISATVHHLVSVDKVR